MCNDYTVFNTKLLDEILLDEMKSIRLHFRFCVSYIPVGVVQNLFMQVDLLVALLGFLDSKSKKKNQKTPPRSSLQFCSLFLCRKPNVGLYGYGFVGF